MQRRRLIAALACLPAWAAAQEGPRHKVSARQLHEALSARFPVRAVFAGLLELRIDAPALLLLPARNRLGATLRTDIGGPMVQPLPPGEMDVSFQLRYEPRDRTVRAFSPEVMDVRWPALPAEITAPLKQALPSLAREAIGEIVLHTLTDRDLALPQAMGLQPDSLRVVDDGLLVLFAATR